MSGRVLVETQFAAPPGTDSRTAILLALNRFSDNSVSILAQHDAPTAKLTEILLGDVVGAQLLILEKLGLRVCATVERGLPHDGVQPPFTEFLLTQNPLGSLDARYVRTLTANGAAARLGISVTELASLQWHADRVYNEGGAYISPFTKFLQTTAV
jgi:hypothetical protein